MQDTTNRNFSAVTNNDLLESLQETHKHMSVLYRMIDKATAPAAPLSPVDEFAFVDEYQDIPNGTSVTISTNAVDPVLISNILYSMPATATGTLSIGDRNIPVASITGLVNSMTDLNMVTYQNEAFTLTSSVPGRLYLEIMGHVLSGDRWSKI